MAEKKSSAVAAAIVALREETGFEDGAEVLTPRLHEMLGLGPEPTREPGESDKAFLRRVRRHEMSTIAPVKRLRDALLLACKVDLQATGRSVYRIVSRADQSSRALREGKTGARAKMRDAIRRIENVDLDRLTPEQRARRDADLLSAKAYLQMLGGRSPRERLDEVREVAAKISAQSAAVMPAMRGK